MKTFSIFRFNGKRDSLRIDDEFMRSLVDVIGFVHSDRSLRKTLAEIVIIKPVVEAEQGPDGVVGEYDGYFTEYGWGLVVERKYLVRNFENRGAAPAVILKKMA